jgi:DNA-binding Xre family transcriptional regulator
MERLKYTTIRVLHLSSWALYSALVKIRSRVVKIMYDKGVTIQQLSEVTGLAVRTIQKARSDRISTCTLDTLLKLAKGLGVTPKSLFIVDK